jgi:hypothetical protein
MPTPTQAAETIYGPSPRARHIMLGVWLLFAVPLTLLGLVEREPAMLLAVAILSAIMLPIFWFVLRAAKLILTDSGIELRQVGARVSTPWSNIAAIRTQSRMEGLVLHQPMSGKGAERLAAVSGFSAGGAPMYDEERRRLLYEQRFIPLDGFAYWLHNGDLHETITRHATAINTGIAYTPGTPPPSEKTPKKTIALIIVIIAASLGLGIASSLSPTVKSAVEPMIAFALMLAFGVYACANFYAAVTRLRAWQFDGFGFALLMALIQAALAFAALGWVFGS